MASSFIYLDFKIFNSNSILDFLKVPGGMQHRMHMYLKNTWSVLSVMFIYSSVV